MEYCLTQNCENFYGEAITCRYGKGTKEKAMADLKLAVEIFKACDWVITQIDEDEYLLTRDGKTTLLYVSRC
jgi:hypothetical protein